MIGGEGVLRVATQRHGEIEAEPVDLHVFRPVAQGVQHEPGRGIRRGVHRVAAAGLVDVDALGGLAVVGAVVDTAQARAGSADALLGGVVVDDVEQHLESGLVQQLDHALELAQHRVGALGAAGGRRVRRVRGEEVQGVVTPVVRQAQLQQARLGGEGVHGQQLDAGDTEREQVIDHGGMRESRVGAVQGGRDEGMPFRQALHVSLVDHGAVHRHPGLRRGAPIERPVDDDRAPVAEAARDETARVRLDEQRLRVEGVSRTVRSADADGIPRARSKQRRRRLEDTAAHGGHRDGLGGPVEVDVVEDEQLHRVGGSRPHAQGSAVGTEAHAEVVEGGTQQPRAGGEAGGQDSLGSDHAS